MVKRSRAWSWKWLCLQFGLVLVFICFALWGLGLTIGMGQLIESTYQKLDTDEFAATDFRAFYFAAGKVFSSERSELYRKDAVIGQIHSREFSSALGLSQDDASWNVFYNPPAYAIMLGPLTLFSRPEAYIVTVGLNLLAICGLLFLVQKLLRWRKWHALLLAGSLFAFVPVHISVFHSQPTILVALLLVATFLAIERKRGLLSCVLLSLVTIKPQWVVLPGLSLLRSRAKLAAPLFATGGSIAFLPFILLGSGALVDYAGLILGRAGVDLQDERYGSWLINSAGFFRALAGSSQPEASIGLSLVTLAIFLLIMVRGDGHLTWAAGILTTLLVNPHAHITDWVIAFPAAAFLLARPMAPSFKQVTLGLLLAAHVSINSLIFTGQEVRLGESVVYWAIPITFALMIWCLVLPILEARFDPVRHRAMPLVPVSQS